MSIKTRIFNKPNFYSITIICLLISIDFVSKYFAIEFLKLNESGNIKYLQPFFSDMLFALIYNDELKNPLNTSPIFQWIIIFIIFSLQLFTCFYLNLKFYTKLSIAIYLSGFANIIEFLYHSHGTDFLMIDPLLVDNHVIIFNLADTYVVFGVFLIIISATISCINYIFKKIK